MNKPRFSVIALLALASGCPRGLEAGPAATPAPAVEVAEPPGELPAETLDALDHRRPVPLLPQMALHQKRNMQDHLVAVQEIVAALAEDDFATVAKTASRIGLSDQMQQTCEHMGAGADGFTERALAFHRQADAIVAAAQMGDKPATLAALGKTLSVCTSCHGTYKQQIVSEAEWAERTGMEGSALGGGHRHHGP